MNDENGFVLLDVLNYTDDKQLPSFSGWNSYFIFIAFSWNNAII